MFIHIRRKTIWILTKVGFFSIVEKLDDVPRGTLTIRSRVRSDLERLKVYLPSMSEIDVSDHSDYRYRTVATREAVSSAMTTLSSDIDYENFKSEISNTQGYARASLYGEVWQVLYGLQSASFEDRPPETKLL